MTLTIMNSRFRFIRFPFSSLRKDVGSSLGLFRNDLCALARVRKCQRASDEWRGVRSRTKTSSYAQSNDAKFAKFSISRAPLLTIHPLLFTPHSSLFPPLRLHC